MPWADVAFELETVLTMVSATGGRVGYLTVSYEIYTLVKQVEVRPSEEVMSQPVGQEWEVADATLFSILVTNMSVEYLYWEMK